MLAQVLINEIVVNDFTYQIFQLLDFRPFSGFTT